MKKYKIIQTNRFVRDLKRIKRNGLMIDHLEEVIEILSRGEQLEPKYEDHEIDSSEYEGYRECCIALDWFLVYNIQDNLLVLTCSRTKKYGN